jgi:hypothetical protein
MMEEKVRKKKPQLKKKSNDKDCNGFFLATAVASSMFSRRTHRKTDPTASRFHEDGEKHKKPIRR